jgi:hypothetical protein
MLQLIYASVHICASRTKTVPVTKKAPSPVQISTVVVILVVIHTVDSY